MYAVEDASEILPGKAADGAALAGGRGGADAPQPMGDQLTVQVVNKSTT